MGRAVVRPPLQLQQQLRNERHRGEQMWRWGGDTCEGNVGDIEDTRNKDVDFAALERAGDAVPEHTVGRAGVARTDEGILGICAYEEFFQRFLAISVGKDDKIDILYAIAYQTLMLADE